MALGGNAFRVIVHLAFLICAALVGIPNTYAQDELLQHADVDLSGDIYKEVRPLLPEEIITATQAMLDEGKPVPLQALVKGIRELPSKLSEGPSGPLVGALGELLTCGDKLRYESKIPVGLGPHRMIASVIMEAFSQWRDVRCLPYLQRYYAEHARDGGLGQVAELIRALDGTVPMPEGSVVLDLSEALMQEQISLERACRLVADVPRWSSLTPVEQRMCRALLQYVLLNAEELDVGATQTYGRAPLHFLTWETANALLTIGKPSDAPLLARVYAHSGDKEGLTQRIRESWGDSAVKELLRAVDPKWRSSFQEAFGATEGKPTPEQEQRIETLLRELADNKTREMQRVDAIVDELRALAPYGDEKVVQAIIARAKAGATFGDVAHSYARVAKMGGDRAFEWCCAKLKEPLPQQYDPEDRENNEAYMRARAAAGLGMLGYSSALPLLRQRAEDSKEFAWVRETCQSAIKRIEYLQTIYQIEK
jgi:hypothetical protein